MNQTSGQQFTIVNRVAWCDTYFHKAGFVSKERHHKDSMQDVFRITQVGQMQINRHVDRIDVGYLQSFYQGKVYRGAASGTVASDAELDLYERLADLPDPWVSFHSISWIGQGTRTVGEIDFLVVHPDHGVLVLEVKGGGIFIEREGNRNQWYSRSQSGTVNSIHDPCGQAIVPFHLVGLNLTCEQIRQIAQNVLADDEIDS